MLQPVIWIRIRMDPHYGRPFGRPSGSGSGSGSGSACYFQKLPTLIVNFKKRPLIVNCQ